jgi:hypothetical protein
MNQIITYLKLMLAETERQTLLSLLTKLTVSKGSGFHPITPNRRYDYIYVKAQDKPEGSQGVWHRLAEENGNSIEVYLHPTEQARFEGDLVDVLLVKIQTKFGEQLKIDLIFDTGDELLTVIRSGASTFSEGILRSLMCIEVITNPLNIIPQRADKSDKAVFGLVKMNGKKLLLDKDMARLITWNPKSKPTIDQVASAFLPAINIVRKKLGLDPLTEPIDRDAEYEQSKQSTLSTLPKISEVEPSIFTDEQIKTALAKLQWGGQKVTEILKDNFKCERIGSLNNTDRAKFTQILEQAINAQSS